ncbi:MAG: hypothetical protein IJL89_02100 [Firmicutes bacterium]|nr:hypothetical protein [Bacillota bacterium]
MDIIAKLDKKIYSCITNDIITEEVIITERQIRHIKENHAGDYEQFSQYFRQILSEPDYILEANKINSGIVLKEIKKNDLVFKTVLRIITSADDKNYKNSIITFMKIDQKEWNRLLRNKKILYKRE